MKAKCPVCGFEGKIRYDFLPLDDELCCYGCGITFLPLETARSTIERMRKYYEKEKQLRLERESWSKWKRVWVWCTTFSE